MKRLFTVAIGVALCACAVFAQNPVKSDYLNIAWPTTYTNGTFYSTGTTTNAYDLTAYNGQAKLLVWVSGDEGSVANTNTSTKVFLQHAPYNTGTWATVTDAAVTNYMPTLTTTAKVAQASIDLETLKNWVRIGVTQSSLGETGCQHTVGAMIVAPHKSD